MLTKAYINYTASPLRLATLTESAMRWLRRTAHPAGSPCSSRPRTCGGADRSNRT
jgi:hypothetical protein